jgi:hypothetical protein
MEIKLGIELGKGEREAIALEKLFTQHDMTYVKIKAWC